MRRLLPLLLLAACADQAPTPALTAWVGAREADLVAARGVPNRVFDVEGRRFLAYDEAGVSQAAVTPSIGIGFGSVSGGWGRASGVGLGTGLSFGPAAVAGPCTTTFEVQEGRVVSATRQGPGCG
jgi:hypothetical protein